MDGAKLEALIFGAIAECEMAKLHLISMADQIVPRSLDEQILQRWQFTVMDARIDAQAALGRMDDAIRMLRPKDGK